MKLLHTSDWHLARSLYDRKRYHEFEAFLDWLIRFIGDEHIGLLLVSGDIFDSTTPSNRAQELYYHFLSRLPATGCRHAVITGGNHDSPTFLDAPKNLLGALNIHVVGAMTGNPEDEIIVLKDKNGENEAIVCAVPFLRDRDLRTVEGGESPDDKTQKLLQGLEQHYKEIAALAQKFQDSNYPVPVIGMGHLFTRNAITTEGDGVRELYIGSIAHVDGNRISGGFDYMALGHLHMAQRAGGSETVRYSGSPIPMGFAESTQTKKVIVADFQGSAPVINEHSVPCFRKLVSITGNTESVSDRIGELKAGNDEAWLEIEITSPAPASELTSHFDELLKGSRLEILRIKNRSIVNIALAPVAENETLDDLNDSEVFSRCLDACKITEPGERRILTETYREAIDSMVSEDTNAI